MRGYPFPDMHKLERGLALRQWTRETLAEKAGIGIGTAYRAVAGKPIAIETIRRIALALLVNPPEGWARQLTELMA